MVKLRDVPEGARVELPDGRRGRRVADLNGFPVVRLNDDEPLSGPSFLDPELEVTSDMPARKR